MVIQMVDRATSDMLIGPDWAKNLEICDILNREPGQAKDALKRIKKRIGSKNSKVQLLALTLLETVVKNCGEVVHMHVAERDLLHDMVKIVKKKPDYQVKQKILILIDTWQEAFGGPKARYPQYYAAYQELLRVGAVFPQRSESSVPVFTPPQSHPLASYPQIVRNSEPKQDNPSATNSSAESEFPTLSLSEIQNARGSLDVLTEMLSAVHPGNKEGLRQETLVDLVGQCRTYKQRVVHLVNSTSDESLLCKGLALNDDLQRILAKYESLLSGRSVVEEKPKPDSAARNLVEMGSDPLVNNGESSSKQANGGSASKTHAVMQQPSIPASTLPANGTNSVTKTNNNPKMDLLSGDLLGGGDDQNSTPTQNSLAIVPVSSGGQPSSPVASDQNALALNDMFSNPPNPSNGHPRPTSFPAGPEFQQQQQRLQPQQCAPIYQNGATVSPYEQQPGYHHQQVSSPTWGAQSPQQPLSPGYGSQNGRALPPPPWELQAVETSYSPTMQVAMIGGGGSSRTAGATAQYPPLGLPTLGNEQVVGVFVQPVTSGQLSAINQSFQMSQPGAGMYPQQQQQQLQFGGGGQNNMMGMLSQAMQATQMAASMYPTANMHGNQMQMGNQMQIMGNQMQIGSTAQMEGNQMQMTNQMQIGNEVQMGNNYGYGNGYGYQQDAQQLYLDQRMSGLSMKDDDNNTVVIRSRSSSSDSVSSYLLPHMKQQLQQQLQQQPPKAAADDIFFGDLVNVAKLKPKSTSA